MVNVSQKRRTILDWIAETFGCGSVRRKNFKEGHGRFGEIEMHQWECAYDNAYRLVKAIYPYLRVKRRQAELVIEFQEMKLAARQPFLKGMRGRLATPDHILARYRELCTEVQSLNGRVVVRTGPKNSDAPAKSVSAANLTCAACGKDFVSDTYFGRRDLLIKNHYCPGCRASGEALRHQKQRYGALRRKRLRPNAVTGVCPVCASEVGGYIPRGGDGSLWYGMPHGKNRGCGGPNAGEIELVESGV